MFTSKIPSGRCFMSAVILCAALAITALGQITGVDPTFNAVPSLPLTSGLSHLVQPDGKVIVYGSKTVTDGVVSAYFVRLNSDGTRDPSFSYCDCALTTVASARLLPDGKIVVSGNEIVNSNRSDAKIIRLNPDGSVDPTFLVYTQGGPDFSFPLTYYVEAVQPDGKILAMRRSRGLGTNVTYDVSRFNTDGTPDSSFTGFTVVSGSNFSASIRIEFLPDGRFYIASTITGGGFNGTTGAVNRRNANGSLDSTWQSPGITSDPSALPNVHIHDLAVAADGGVLVVGSFLKVNGVDKVNFVKLLPAGNVDMGFPAPPISASRVVSLPDGKILIAGSTIRRLLSDGTPDDTFTMDPAVQSVRSRFDVDSSQRIILFAETAAGIRLIRLLPSGALDGTFQTNIASFGRVHATAVQSNGKVLIAGVFSHMNGVPRSSFARVNLDGTFDPTFDPHSAFDQPPEKLLVQPDGKILAKGPFTTYDTVAVPGLVRINADGSRDATFNPTISSRPLGIALEPDGQILISGSFGQVNGATRTGLARLNADGTLDTTLNPVIGAPEINAVIAQDDGKIVIGGRFNGINGFSRNNLARLSNTGAVDESFVVAQPIEATILERQPDGKYLVVSNSFIWRYNSNGSRDLSFAMPTSNSSNRILAIALQADGSMIIGGGFDGVGSGIGFVPRPNLARLSSTGALDVLFLTTGTDAPVRTLSQYSPTKVIVGGDFTSINNVTKDAIARLDVNTARATTPFDFDGDGRADVTVYRPSTGVWYQLFSSGLPYGSPAFGQAGDIPAPADFDGDGKTDISIFRPSTGTWWYIPSTINQIRAANLNHAADALPMPSDVDGDGKDDFVVYRPSNNTWYWTTATNSQATMIFGVPGDVPLIADFDGDGKSDRAIFRPSNGDWWYLASSSFNSLRNFHWGQTGDIPAPADYDGDGKTDFAVFRPSDGGWYIIRSSDLQVITTAFGLAGDRPVAADYDGDGRADIAVFRPSNGIWYLNQSTSGTGGLQWGLATDVAIPNAFTQQ